MKDHPLDSEQQEIAAKDFHFHEEEFPMRLLALDAAKVAEALEKPPAPNESARRAARRFRKEFG